MFPTESAIRARSVIYDRMRSELLFPELTLPSVVSGLETSATLPMPQRGTSTFGDTHPVDNTGFHETKPVVQAADAASAEPKQKD